MYLQYGLRLRLSMPDQQTDPDGAEPIHTVLNKQDTSTDHTAHSVGSHNALEPGSHDAPETSFSGGSNING